MLIWSVIRWRRLIKIAGVYTGKLFMPKLFDSPAMRETLRRTIRAEMAYKGFEYRDLAAKLADMGVRQTEANLRSKINNGSLGAQLFVFLLLAMGTRNLELGRVSELLEDVVAEQAERQEGVAEGKQSAQQL